MCEETAIFRSIKMKGLEPFPVFFDRKEEEMVLRSRRHHTTHPDKDFISLRAVRPLSRLQLALCLQSSAAAAREHNSQRWLASVAAKVEILRHEVMGPAPWRLSGRARGLLPATEPTQSERLPCNPCLAFDSSFLVLKYLHRALFGLAPPNLPPGPQLASSGRCLRSGGPVVANRALVCGKEESDQPW